MAQCQGKEAFEEPMAREIAKRQRRKKANVTAYRCGYCKKWHIGADYTPRG